MLEHSRAEGGDWRETDLNALAQAVPGPRLSRHARREPELQPEDDRRALDDAVGMLEVVPQDISRAFLNILTNACQAIDEKRLHRGRGLRAGTRRSAAGGWPTRFEFWVRDNGPGIPTDLRQRMFEPFVTTKDTGKGTGLGLSLTADIITRHGGHDRRRLGSRRVHGGSESAYPSNRPGGVCMRRFPFASAE